MEVSLLKILFQVETSTSKLQILFSIKFEKNPKVFDNFES